MLRRLVVVGPGLIGGSFALAHKARAGVAEVVGLGRSPASLERALALRIIDRIALDAQEALAGCDLVLIAAPVAQTGTILAALAPFLERSTVVTDAGSTKASVVTAARAALGQRIGQFVPAHPIAGGETSGPDAARANLFEARTVILTPLAENSPAVIGLVDAAWRDCGATVVTMTPEGHDTALAAVSHLPHVLAYALVAHVAAARDGARNLALAGSGFRDATRIAASNPEMWRDIVLANRDAVLAQMDGYGALLETLRDLIAKGDGAALEALFSAARATRNALSPAPSATPEP